MKKIIIAVVVLVVGAGAYMFWPAQSQGQGGASPGGAPPPPEVIVQTIQRGNIDLFQDLPGRTQAFKVAEIRPQVSGIIITRLFEEGSDAPADGSRMTITSAAAQRDGHRWRARASAILTGVDTVLADDPQLTVRLDVPHTTPLRVIADTRLRTPPTARLLRDTAGRVLIVCGETADGERRRALEATGAEVVALPFADGRIDLHALMALLAERHVNELHVEAGAALAGAMLHAGLIDECVLYQSHALLGADARPVFAGALAPMRHWTLHDERRIGPDRRLALRPKPVD